MKTIVYFLVTALLIWAVATYGGDSAGIKVTGENAYISALLFAVILTLVNLIIGTILRILTFPFNFLTFGIIYGLITLLMIYITDSFYDNLAITSFVGYIVIAFIPSITGMLLGKK